MRLLHDVYGFMGEEFQSGLAMGLVLIGSEADMVSGREGVAVQLRGRFGGFGVGVYAYLAEVTAK